ncbi:MAG: phytanoyl-CoA dioxygenase [Hyphomicrobiaceae bacterium]
MTATDEFPSTGIACYRGALDDEQMSLLATVFPYGETSRTPVPWGGAVLALASGDAPLMHLARAHLPGKGIVRPVRAVLFDKGEDENRRRGWHQDHAMVVMKRADLPGIERWDRAIHELSTPLLEAMVSVRCHLDGCVREEEMLRVVPGSHMLGRIAAADARELAAVLGSTALDAAPGDVYVLAKAIVHSSHAADHWHRRVLQVDYANVALPDGLQWQGIRAIR